MGYLEQLISSGIFLTLKQKYDQGYNISKNELRTLIESCKGSHEKALILFQCCPKNRNDSASTYSRKPPMLQKIMSSNVCETRIDWMNSDKP